MKVTQIPGRELSSDLETVWSRLRRVNPAFDSPYLHPAFTRIVGTTQWQVEVAIFEDAGTIAGFFPYERRRGDIGRPVGATICDAQGVVVADATDWSASRLVRACGLRAWYFDHLVTSQNELRPYYWTRSASPYIDLSGGFERYLKRRVHTGSRQLTQLRRKGRKAAREIGPLRLTVRSDSDELVRTLISWKRQQYRRAGVPDLLAPRWTQQTLARLGENSTDEFGTMLSTLHIGNHLAALHLGLRAGSVLHWWFPAYALNLAKYSPGSLLLLELARAAPSLGITRIDLGKGDERYKFAFASGSREVAEGCVDTRQLAGRLHRASFRLQSAVHASTLGSSLRKVTRGTRRLLSTWNGDP